MTMRKRPTVVRLAAVLVLPLAVVGCSTAIRSTPDNPTSAGGLTPNVKDKDAGLVGMAPGFDVSKYTPT